MERRLLALHAHPDDESSKGAGTVARYAAAGVDCVLVTATGGEAGEILNPAMDRPGVVERLAEIRRIELEEAARIIGYREVVLLGYRDSGMPDTEANRHPDAFVNAPFEEVVARAVELVRRFRPHVVLGYDEHVRYPHPDHVRIHDLALEVFDAAADPGRFPEAGTPWEVAKLYAPVFTRRRVVELHTEMLALGLESPFDAWLERMEDHVDPDAVTRIDVTAHLETAREALRAHRTQVDPDGFWFQVPIELIRRTYPYEDFEVLRSRIAVALDEDDLFAGL